MNRNEELRLGEEGDEEVVGMDLTSEEKEVHAKITKNKRLLVQEHRMKKNTIDQLHKKLRVMSNSRSRSRLRGEVVPGEGFKDYAQKQIALKIAYKSNKKRNKQARKGEADRTILNLRPKHLFSGKRRIGKTNRR